MNSRKEDREDLLRLFTAASLLGFAMNPAMTENNEIGEIAAKAVLLGEKTVEKFEAKGKESPANDDNASGCTS